MNPRPASLLIALLYCCLHLPPLWGQSDTLRLAQGTFGIDHDLRLILVYASADQLPKRFAVVRTPAETFDLPRPVERACHTSDYLVQSTGGTDYRLFFTAHPLVTLRTSEPIVDDPKVGTVFTYADAEQVVLTTGGVEKRGASQLNRPKGALDLELDTDERFAHLREDDDWVLDGVYNETLRINSYVAHRLWLEQHRPYYAERDSRARAGANVLLTEVFLNGHYRGIHVLSEQVDRKLLRIKKHSATEGIRGQLYKSYNDRPGTRFAADAPAPVANDRRWSGYEQKYPRTRDTVDYSALRELYELVTAAPDATFRNQIVKFVQLDNAIDYLLFLNLTGLWDNAANNVITARYDRNEPYFFVPWDLDGSFGNYPGRWCNEAGYDFWYDNGLFERLVRLNPDGFNERLCARWEVLRSGVYSQQHLNGLFDRAYLPLHRQGVYAREELAWGREGLAYDSLQLDFAKQWISNRLRVLDRTVCELVERRDELRNRPYHCTVEYAFPVTVYPNPAADRLTVHPPAPVPLAYQIFSLAGLQLVLEGSLLGITTLDISSLPPGGYVIRVGERRAKFIVR